MRKGTAMKRMFLSIIIVLSCFVVQAGQNHTLFNTLNSNQDHHYIANSYIALITGFQSEPSDGHEVTLEIDSYGVFPPESGITGGSDINNGNGVVGSLGGIVDVSLLGGAVYSIPIDLPSGLGEMKPDLCILYNNQSHNGLLGWAWTLKGISSITRTGCTRYHDGYTYSVDYIHDRFCLDGQRLMKTSDGDYGASGVSYRTEQDQLTKITSYQEAGIAGTAFFKVWTADGKTLYYGTTSDSRGLMNSQNYITTWLLKKVVDRDGNYIEYHYCNEPNTYRLSSITYSGNANNSISPVFTVEFQYNDRSDIELAYYGNRLFRQEKILTGIIIKNGDNPMYSYQFTYKSPDPTNGYPYHLLSEVRLSAGDKHLNSTKIKWGSNNYHIVSGADVKVNVTTNGISDAFINAVKFCGDFNGDGYSDVVVTQPNSDGSYTNAYIFVNRGVNGNATFSLNSVLPLSEDISWIYVADFNGDGYDDILLSNRDRRILGNPDILSSTIYLSQFGSTGVLTFKAYQTPAFQIPHSLIDTHLVGDYFGEGKCSILIQAITNDQTYNSKLLTYDASSDKFKLRAFVESLSGNRFYPADYNGDGITEILYKKEDGSTGIAQVRTTNSGSYCFVDTYSGAPTNWSDCFPGDYNGDGLIDALFYNSSNSSPWTIYLSNQLGISGVTFSLPDTFPYSSPGDYLFSLDQPNHTSQFIKVADFDGNGCSDLGLFHDNVFYVFYGPLRANGDSAPFANNQRVSTQLFNLYDNMATCLGNFLGKEGISYLGNNTISFLPPMTRRHEVQRITDGFGRFTEFTYDYLMPNLTNPSNNDFYRLYSPSSNLSLHTHCVGIPLRALRKVTKYNIKNKPIETRCFYEGALINTQGKGVLGFSKTRQADYCNNQLQQNTIRQFDVILEDQTLHMMASMESVYDGSEHLVAKSTYTNTLYLHLGNTKVFFPISKITKDEYDVDHPGNLTKREIQEVAVNTNCSYILQYDNVICVTNQIKGITGNPEIHSASLCEYQQIVQTDYEPNDLTHWLINKPSTVTETLHRNGNYADISRQQVFSYFSNKPHRIQSILSIPNDGIHPEDRLTTMTSFQYDGTGNIISKTISTPNDTLAPRNVSYEYSLTYGKRLLTRQTDALNQVTRYQYHPVYSYCISETDYNNLETRHEQDPFGITKKTYHPDGTVSCEAMRWGDNKYYRWEKKTGQPTKVTYYDMTGEIVQARSYDMDGGLLLTDYQYNALGRINEKSYPHRINETPSSIQYEYDNHNRINRITHADGAYETIQYNGYIRSTSFKVPGYPERTESKTFNTIGKLIKSTDADGNSVIYDYDAAGRTTCFQIEGRNETKIEMTYDALGNRTSLSDPNYGLTTYEYNAFNELTKSTSPKLDETAYFYDKLGRAIRRVETDATTNSASTTEWRYGQEKGQYGMLMGITYPNQTIDYEYDELLRPSRMTENLFGTNYQTNYFYDNASRVARIIHPSNYEVSYCYTSEGYLRSVMDSQSNDLWKVSETNALMQPTQCTTGNDYITYYDYDNKSNRLTSIQTIHDGQTIQDYEYQYDRYSNMTCRSDVKTSFSESFSYDNLNRLTGVTDNKGSSHFVYDELGRMTEKYNADGMVFSNADYSGSRPHAVKSVQAPNGIFPQQRMDLTFNAFDKVAHITEGTNHVSFEYGYGHQRIKTVENINGKTRNKTYVGNCEFITTPDGGSTIRTLLSGPNGVFAVAESVNGTTTLHYVHKDHLGSWTTISDSQGNIEQETRFDVWGQCDDPDNLMFDRGFTGHEHIKGMGLINMNGRLYDPITSSMLSPDNNIQSPEFTQNLNRYAYCFNNPLTYTDPDGNTITESVLKLFYYIYFTDAGYEFQKYISPIAIHMDLHLSDSQLGIGFDCSFGVPKCFPVSARFHGGITYYGQYFDNSYSGMEYRTGMEWCFLGFLGISGTSFYQGETKQTTNAIILGTPSWSITYENDYMFHLGDHLLMGFAADGGDRYRTAAARIRVGLFEVGVNLFTGNPGVNHKYRRTIFDPTVDSPYYDESAGGRETYTIGANGEDPNQYRAGVFYVGYGPLAVGANNEQIRNVFQNQFAHDFLCKGDSPYFKVLDRQGQSYFHFGSRTGNTLW